jgi:hypothetical protein
MFLSFATADRHDFRAMTSYAKLHAGTMSPTDAVVAR